jgi:hypothetical protein
MFTEKGEMKLTAAYAAGPSRSIGDADRTFNRGYDLQAAYAVTDHLALLGSYSGRSERDRIQGSINNTVISQVDYRRSSGEFGVSYFLPIDRRGGSFFHVDGGLGFGSDRFTDQGTFDSLGLTRYFRNNTRRFFLQPGIYVGSEEVKFAMGVKMQWVNFRNIETDYTAAELAAYSLSGLGEVFTVEPYAAFRVVPRGLPWLGFEIQGSFATVNKDYFIRGAYASIGLVVMPKGIKK